MKSQAVVGDTYEIGRPRKGAWIEIIMPLPARPQPKCRPRKGAWIEIWPGKRASC